MGRIPFSAISRKDPSGIGIFILPGISSYSPLLLLVKLGASLDDNGLENSPTSL